MWHVVYFDVSPLLHSTQSLSLSQGLTQYCEQLSQALVLRQPSPQAQSPLSSQVPPLGVQRPAPPAMPTPPADEPPAPDWLPPEPNPTLVSQLLLSPESVQFRMLVKQP